VAAKALSELIIGRIEEVLADVVQKMKIANEVPRGGKYLHHRFVNTDFQVMNIGSRLSMNSLYFSHEGNNVVGVLAGQLHIGENDLAQAVHTRHQRRSIPIIATS
jgi:hypothetical protein